MLTSVLLFGNKYIFCVYLLHGKGTVSNLRHLISHISYKLLTHAYTAVNNCHGEHTAILQYIAATK